jgi:hypothetical protein
LFTSTKLNPQQQLPSSSSFSHCYTNYSAPAPISYPTPSSTSMSTSTSADDTIPITSTAIAIILPSENYLSFVLAEGEPVSGGSSSEVSDFGDVSIPHLV